MQLHHPHAVFLVPDGVAEGESLGRTTHLGIGAHQDDLEFFAYHGIEACHGRADRWFTGVTCTDGAGSPRIGRYASFSNGEMAAVRREEQNQAAVVGGYAAMIQLGYPSREIKDASCSGPVDDLEAILRAARPEVVYLHNPADKHDTHVAVLLRSLAAIRRLPVDERPREAWGCEGWRGLDWLLDEDKGVLPVGSSPELQAALNGVFDSQIAGGKRYDLAVIGRRLANATFHESHAADAGTGLSWAIDLSPLVRDETLDVVDYTLGFLDRLKQDVADRIARFR